MRNNGRTQYVSVKVRIGLRLSADNKQTTVARLNVNMCFAISKATNVRNNIIGFNRIKIIRFFHFFQTCIQQIAILVDVEDFIYN